MTLRATFLSLGLLATTVMPAFSDDKCNDPGSAPAPFGSKGEYVVTLVGPTPHNAKVNLLTRTDVFDAVNKVMGPEFPAGYPTTYTQNIQRVEPYNLSLAWDIDELHRWDKRHGIQPTEDVTAVFKKYLDGGNTVRMMLLPHPKVAHPLEFRNCSVVLQRGVVIWEKGVETLFLRSYARSVAEGKEGVNIAPTGAVRMVFDSDAIWFPLETTRLVQEPASFVQLDVLTPSPLASPSWPSSFKVEKTARVTYQGKTYSAARLTAKLEVQKAREFPDLSVKAQSAR